MNEVEVAASAARDECAIEISLPDETQPDKVNTNAAKAHLEPIISAPVDTLSLVRKFARPESTLACSRAARLHPPLVVAPTNRHL